MDEILEYCLDCEDEEFLGSFNETVERKVSEDDFEKIFDTLEKQAYKKVTMPKLNLISNRKEPSL